MMTNNESCDIPDGELPGLKEDNRVYLKKIAREAVENYIHGKPAARPVYEDKIFNFCAGAFVTLKVNGNLRGCIGTIVSDKPIPETIAGLAVKSASSDPRFPPIGPAELPGLDIEISILGPLKEVVKIDEIKIGRDGLVIEYFGRHGLLLPQVATEHGLDLLGFLSQTCLKAGLPPDAWKKGARIYRFTAEVF
jgi:AmmeMemoRadiSam system protein A